jgi:drug/metabolite transporter (DMT)-like permease
MSLRSAAPALAAALLFGASTPLAKLLIGDTSPLMLAGLLYLGSGVGLGLGRLMRDRAWKRSGLSREEWPWLLGSTLFGGVLGPVALMYGLTSTPASTASLLLNLEAVLTALIAWVVFKENADRRVVLGMAAIVAGGVVLSWPSGGTGTSNWTGSLAIGAACLGWAIDNNLTRKVSASDALFIAGTKGLVAGAVNCSLALAAGVEVPTAPTLLSAVLVGLLGYGLSLALFVVALRGLGAARTGAYFSTAPFIGTAVALVLLGEPTSPAFWLASSLMACGVWLHLTERHDHAHTHEPLAHEHSHRHDEHHQHLHASDERVAEPHVHRHWHGAITHKHPHYPDIHHGHGH